MKEVGKALKNLLGEKFVRGVKYLGEEINRCLEETHAEVLAEEINARLDSAHGYKNREKYVILKNGIEWQVWRNELGSSERFLKEFNKRGQIKLPSDPFGRGISSGISPLDAFVNAFNVILDKNLDR